jgi:hypothetical protein
MNYKDAFNIGSIQLEPRLQEFIRRKKFNEENDIEPPIPEEKEFCITPHDLKIIKRFKQGKEKIYTSKRLAKDPHFVKPDNDGFEEANNDNDFKKDPRYQRLQRKMQSHKDAVKQIRNFEGIDEDYTIFHQSNPYDSNPEKRPNRMSKPYDDPLNDDIEGDSYDGPNDFHGYAFDDRVMMDSRDLVLAPSRPVKKTNRVGSITNQRDEDNQYIQNKPNRNRYANLDKGQYCYNPNQRSQNPSAYHHTPKITYQQRLVQGREQVNGGLQHSRDISDVIGNLDSYNKHLNSTYDYVQSEADSDTRSFTPGSRTSTRRETASTYQSVPFGYGNGLPDVSLEDSLRGGIRDTSRKSIGFKNPFEHQFDYISSDISDSRHTVHMWPQSTRGENKEIARPKSTSVRADKRLRRDDSSKPQGRIKRD